MILKFLSQNAHEITTLAILLLGVFVLFKFINVFTKKLSDKSTDVTLLSFIPLISKVLKIIVLFFAAAFLLQEHGFSITSLIAGFGITGLAVGFGAKETISNIFGSFSLLADKAYGLGDYIIINQSVQDKPVEGIVEEINLRSTKIRCSDGALIIVPNNIVANGVVKKVIANSY